MKQYLNDLLKELLTTFNNNMQNQLNLVLKKVALTFGLVLTIIIVASIVFIGFNIVLVLILTQLFNSFLFALLTFSVLWLVVLFFLFDYLSNTLKTKTDNLNSKSDKKDNNINNKSNNVSNQLNIIPVNPNTDYKEKTELNNKEAKLNDNDLEKNSKIDNQELSDNQLSFDNMKETDKDLYNVDKKNNKEDDDKGFFIKIT